MDRPAADAVEELRITLGMEVDPANEQELRARREDLQRQAATIRRVADLRRALVLQEWRDEDPEPKIAAVDRAVRQEMANRLANIIRAALKSNDVAAREAAITEIGEIGATIRGIGRESSLASEFIAGLAPLLRDENPGVREAAARALSRAASAPDSSAGALGAQLRDPNVENRLVAARALTDMVRQIVQQARFSSVTGVRVGRPEVVAIGHAVVLAATPGLKDQNAAVRGACLDAIYVSAGMFGLGELLPVTNPAAEAGLGKSEAPAPRLLAREREDFMPLVEPLARATPDVARLLTDPEPADRLLAARILADLSYARARFLRRAGGLPGAGALPEKKVPTVLVAQQRLVPSGLQTADDNSPPGVVRRALVGVLPELGRALHDPDLRVRLAAIDTLEWLDQDAAPAAPDITAALSDQDRFVRWAAARTLGKLGPRTAQNAIPGLAGMLRDEDVDVRLAACVALERMGPTAASAGPVLARTVTRGDAEVRVAAARAIQSIRPRSPEVAEALAAALGNENVRVRRAAAEALSRLGDTARLAVPELRQALSDRDEDVRRAASDALLTILAPSPER